MEGQLRPIYFLFTILLFWPETCRSQDLPPPEDGADAGGGGGGGGAPNITTFPLRPWLRVCTGKIRTDKKGYVLRGSDCTGGYFFTKPFPAGACVCANGMWILKSGYCNEGTTTIIFAEPNTCYKIKSPIKWIRYVGHPEVAKLDSHYLASQNWDYIERLSKSTPSRLVASPLVWTLAVGDSPQNIYLPGTKYCLRSDWRPIGVNPNATGSPYARVGRSQDPNPQDIPQPHQAQILSYCPYFGKEENTEWIQPGGMFTVDGQGKATFLADMVDAISGQCAEDCDNHPPFQDFTRTTQKPAIEAKMDEKNLIAEYPTSEEATTNPYDTHNDTDVDMDAAVRLECPLRSGARDADILTLRMIRSQTGYSLKQLKGNKAVIREFRYLQKARLIIQGKCPALPPNLVKSFIRMFRFLFIETMDTHPYRGYGTDESDGRIISALDSCLNNTGGEERNMTLAYVEGSCPPIPSHMPYQVEGEEAPRNCSIRIPSFLKYSCDYDMVMEVTWKVILFTHYFCSKHFINQTQDVSEYYLAMDRLFNPDMLNRFYNPGNSLKGLKFVFQMFNLDKFMNDLDNCLACSRDVSQYRVWLRRPFNNLFCPKSNDDGRALDEYNFDLEGYKGIQRNRKYFPYQMMPSVDPSRTENEVEYRCFGSWLDGLFAKPREQVDGKCGLGMSVVGETVEMG